jgi:NADH-quinone oxidoreductase subunit N
VVIAVLNSVVSAYFYIGIIVAMYMSEGAAGAPIRPRPALVAAVAIAMVATVMIGVYPGPYLDAAASAFTSAYGPRPAPSAPTMMPMP